MAHTLMVDAVTAEVVGALRRSGVRPLLLKGPTLATWLYDGDVVRTYGDSDLLVAAGDRDAAQAQLRSLGFEEQMTGMAADDVLLSWSGPWRRDRSVVDLHTSYYGIGVNPGRALEVLARDTEQLTVARAPVEGLAHPQRALLVALHAAHHGGQAARAMVDLERAVRLLPDDLWRDAASVADELDAVGAFAAGLTLLPEGERLAQRIGVAGRESPESTLRRTEVAEGFARLHAARGARARAGLLARELMPSPEFLRWRTSLARRGRRGLAAAYVWRWMWLARRAPAGYRAFRRMRRGDNAAR
jgi:hypothetical protein